MPDFYFAIGRSPSARDWAVCRLVGQRSFLVPAGSPAERTLRTMPDVSVILDSGAYPPGNTARPTLRQYGWIVRWWSGQLDRFAWAVSYDTLGDPARTARDHDRLLDLPWRWPDDIPVVPVRAYPHHSADDILAEVNDNRADFDDEECAQYDRLRAAGELAAPPAPSSMSPNAACTCSASVGPTGSPTRWCSPSTPPRQPGSPASAAGMPCGARMTRPSASR